MASDIPRGSPEYEGLSQHPEHEAEFLPHVCIIQELLPPPPQELKERMTMNDAPGAILGRSVNGEVAGGGEGVTEEDTNEKRDSWVASFPATSSDSSWMSEPEEQHSSSSKLTRSKGKLQVNGAVPTEFEKILKLSPTRLGELLGKNPGAPVLLRPASPNFPRSPTFPTEISRHRRRRSTTNPLTHSLMPPKVSSGARPHPAPQQRTLSAPPSIRRSKSSPRVLQLNSQASATRFPHQQRGRTAQKAVDAMPAQTVTSSTSTPVLRFDPTNDLLSMNSKKDSTPHTTKESGAASTSAHTLVPAPVAVQSYLSRALSSPNSAVGRPLMNLPPPQMPGVGQYGPPQHHPDDTAGIAIERIMNFLLLPVKLEGAMWFGALACLDSWLYMFTILPLRFMRAVGVLCAFWWASLTGYCRGRRKEGKGHKQRGRRSSSVDKIDHKRDKPMWDKTPLNARRKTKRVSDLLPSHKADILRGLVVFCTCWILMRFDASRMYHSIRGQNGIKLYVIYNMLEISDKLCSALGQDIFECLFSKETLERGPDGRSKVLRPFGFFLLGLAYNTVHSTALFYQVITLNVAVNSYSNALVTLVLSVQFVEIKSTVFKKFEKENLFQLTCADIVERFQLWLMLVIIASRNLVEVGVWSLAGMDSSSAAGLGVMPKSFTMFPKWTGQVMDPFLIVLGSEMLVDWLKHAYITKFNNTRPSVYERFLDVLSKDYHSHAFTDQNLTKRLGLPVIPLACLFIRASLQTYQMFLATRVPPPMPSTTTSLSESHTSRVTSDALTNLDALLRRALGHSTTSLPNFFPDDLVAFAMLLVFFVVFFLVFLALKLILGICLLNFARGRYRGMKDREKINFLTGARRVGGFGTVEINEDQKKWIYADDPEGAELVRKRDSKPIPVGPGLETVRRYSMAAKRIW